MTDPDRLTRVSEDPRYRLLVRRRGRFGLILALIVLAVYFGYILLIAFNRDLLARPIGDGVTSLGIPIGIGIILLSIVLTGIYVRVANRDYDALERAIREEYGQ